ncbi:MAG TPA: dienelactone hydrolase family protein [Candidatus Limnocylindrales bacterium]|jgi:carboxymethylenebutenolidase
MCFDLDSDPPIRPLADAAVDHESLTLRAADGNSFRAFHAWPLETTGRAIVILPDVRGLHHYYEELAIRFAEIGVEAVAIDYFGRTAGIGDRGDDFDFGPHVAQTTWAGLSADIERAAKYLKDDAGHGARSLFTTGFCMGGRNAFLSATLGLGLSGVIGFYGWPGGPSRNDTPAPTEVVGTFECPVLGIFGGADQGIPITAVQQFRDALASVPIEHEIVVEPDAPHSFFDRKQAEFQKQSDDAWARIQRFIEAHGAN